MKINSIALMALIVIPVFLMRGIPSFAYGNSVDDKAKKVSLEPPKNLQQEIFSISSEELDSTDSLNRIAGDFDRGYSSPEQSFKSSNQAPASPFAREKSAMASQKKDQSPAF